jgi:hypothetical protein
MFWAVPVPIRSGVASVHEKPLAALLYHRTSHKTSRVGRMFVLTSSCISTPPQTWSLHDALARAVYENDIETNKPVCRACKRKSGHR